MELLPRNRKCLSSAIVRYPSCTIDTDDRYLILTASKQNKQCHITAKTLSFGNRTNGVKLNSPKKYSFGQPLRTQTNAVPLTSTHYMVRRIWPAELPDWMFSRPGGMGLESKTVHWRVRFYHMSDNRYILIWRECALYITVKLSRKDHSIDQLD